MRRSASVDVERIGTRDEARRIVPSLGPDVPCRVWDGKAMVEALEPRTLHLSNVGEPGALFFVARDVEAEKAAETVGLYSLYHHDSGTRIPLAVRYQDPNDVVEAGRRFFGSIDPDQRKAAMGAMAALARERWGRG